MQQNRGRAPGNYSRQPAGNDFARATAPRCPTVSRLVVVRVGYVRCPTDQTWCGKRLLGLEGLLDLLPKRFLGRLFALIDNRGVRSIERDHSDIFITFQLTCSVAVEPV